MTRVIKLSQSPKCIYYTCNTTISTINGEYTDYFCAYHSPTAHIVKNKSRTKTSVLIKTREWRKRELGKSGFIRKTRSDKKRDVKPTLTLELKDNIYRLSHLCKMPVKDIAERLCIEGIDSASVVHKLSSHFKRDVRLRNTLYRGSLDNPPTRKNGIITGRITIKFKAEDYENMSLLAYTMDVTPSRAVAILINASIKDLDISEPMLRDNMKINWMSDSDRTELSILMKYIRGSRPNEDRASWAELMKFAAGEVGDFVINGWRKE